MVVLKKVSDLDPVGALSSTDLIVINQLDGVSRKVNIAQIQGYGFVLTSMIGAVNGVPSLVNGNIPDTQISNSIVRSPQLTSGLAVKADQTALTSGLALKADQTALTNGLALKADQTALTNGLALKADQTALTNGLALKADITASVDLLSAQSISGVKTFSNGLLLGVPLPISQGGLGSTTVSTARANLGIFGSKYLSKTTNYTIADSESGSTIDVDSSAGSCTINLPPISNATVNAVFIIRKIDSSVNTVTIHGNLDNDLINGLPTYVLSSRNQTVTLIAINAAGWIWLVQNNFSPNLAPTTNATQLQSKNISVTTPLTGQSLVFDGANYTPRVAGKILQVIYAQTTTVVTNSTTTYVSIGITALITPLFTTSKIVIIGCITGIYKTAVNTYGNFRLMRNGISTGFLAYGVTYTNSIAEAYAQVPISFLDSPASISQQTYTVEFNNNAGAGVIATNSTNSLSSLILMEVSA